MAKITGFTEGYTSSGMMKWYAAVLDCSTSGEPHLHFHSDWTPFPSSVKIGDELPCEGCENNAKSVAQLEAMDISQIHYMRYKIQGSRKYYAAYRRDETSPTGVMLITTFPATKEIDAVIDRRRICTLSPTEAR